MTKLSIGQRKVVAEIFGNISVAWFTGGIISPLFTRPENPLRFIIVVTFGLFLAVVFALIALYIVKGVKS